VILATGIEVDKGTNKGKDASGRFRWTDTWVKLCASRRTRRRSPPRNSPLTHGDGPAAGGAVSVQALHDPSLGRPSPIRPD
jgi:hypothetical protein